MAKYADVALNPGTIFCVTDGGKVLRRTRIELRQGVVVYRDVPLFRDLDTRERVRLLGDPAFTPPDPAS